MVPILITIIILLATLLLGQWIINDSLKTDNQFLHNEIVHLRRLSRLVQEGANSNKTPEYFNKFKTIDECSISDEKCLFRIFRHIENLKLKVDMLKKSALRSKLEIKRLKDISAKEFQRYQKDKHYLLNELSKTGVANGG